MDEALAVERLEEWIALAESARLPKDSRTTRRDRYTWSYADGPKIADLRARHDQVRRIVHKVMGYAKLPNLLPMTRGTIELVGGIAMCAEAAARLKTGAETRKLLGTSAPTMAADSLHPEVWNAASKRWGAKHYSDAVQRAATFVNANIQDRVGRHDVSDSELMKEAFSLAPPAEGKPRLRWPGDDSNLSVKSMRVGILSYAQGLFAGVRNIVTHSVAEMPRQVAFEQLCALSLLARWVDECELHTCEDLSD